MTHFFTNMVQCGNKNGIDKNTQSCVTSQLCCSMFCTVNDFFVLVFDLGLLLNKERDQKFYAVFLSKTFNILFLSTKSLLHYRLSTYSIYVFFFFRYTKPKGQLPDYESPVVLKNGQSSIEDFCNSLHKSIMKEFKQ